MTAKQIGDYVDKTLVDSLVGYICVHLGKLSGGKLGYLRKRFKHVDSMGVFGYWRFEK